MLKNIKEEIIIEKETVSDSEYLITDVYKESGSKVEAGELIFSFETSKADIDVEAPADGILYHKLEEQKNVKVGDVVAYISDREDLSPNKLFKERESNTSKKDKNGDIPEDVRISEKARKIIKDNDINLSVFKDKKLIRKKDVIEYLEDDTTVKRFSEGNNECKNDVIIIGGKGGAKMVIEAIRSTSTFGIKGIIDPKMKVGEEVLGIPVLGDESKLYSLKDKGYRNVVLSFSFLNKLKKRFDRYKELKKNGFEFPNIVHRRSTLEPSVNMGEGNIILANSMLGSEVTLGNVNYVNTGAMICHESIINDNNHFAPNSVVAGRVKVGSNSLIGMCATTYFDLEIGDNVTVNNGVNVTSHIEDNRTLKQ